MLSRSRDVPWKGPAWLESKSPSPHHMSLGATAAVILYGVWTGHLPRRTSAERAQGWDESVSMSESSWPQTVWLE